MTSDRANQQVTSERDAYVAGQDLIIYQVLPGDGDLLRAQHSDAGADLVLSMPPVRALAVLTAASASISAGVLEVLWDRGLKARVVSLLAGLHLETARSITLALASLTGPDAEWLGQVPDAAAAVRRCANRAAGRLDGIVEPFHYAGESQPGGVHFRQDHQRGKVFWTVHGGTQVAIGKIGDCRDSHAGALGFPVAPEADAPLGGRLQRFEGNCDYGPQACKQAGLQRFGGTVYWSGEPEAPAHGTWGTIGEFYELARGPAGELGYPISDETKVGPSKRGTRGARQQFKGGTVYCAEDAEATFVRLPVARHHEGEHRGPAGALGFPVSPELEAAPSPQPYGTTGRFQRFEGLWNYPDGILEHWSDRERPGGATIYTSAHGTYCVGWGNGVLYERLGGTGSWLGFPKSDEKKQRPLSNGKLQYTVQEFEGGEIIHDPGQGRNGVSVAVPRATMEYLDRHAGLRERLGLPLSRPLTSSTADEPVQFFENGVVVLRDGNPEAYLRAVASLGEVPQSIRLTALNFTPENVAPGEVITLEYAIQALPCAPAAVMLGASLITKEGDEYYDKYGDLKVDVGPGKASYRRPFRVPSSAPPGAYSLIGAVWHPFIGEERLDSLDRGPVVTITTSMGE